MVDDEPDLRLLVRFTLEADGFDVVEAGSGEDALEAISKDAPNVVLLDIKLPGIDGWEVVRRVREQGNGLPIVMVSAHASDTTSRLAEDAGCNGYVAKPFRPDELRAAIDEATGAASPTQNEAR